MVAPFAGIVAPGALPEGVLGEPATGVSGVVPCGCVRVLLPACAGVCGVPVFC